MSEQDPLSFEVFRSTGPDEHGRRRVHQLTPLIQAVRWWPAVLVAAVTLPGQMQVSVGGSVVAIGAGVLVLMTSLAVFWNYLEWQRLSFWFDEDGDLRVQSGVLTKQERRLQVSRLQSVDVLQPLLARLAGLAEVRIEVAGAGDSRQNLQFLTLAEANALRNEVIARSAGVRHDAEEAPETLLAKVPPGDLVLSLILRMETAVLLLATVLLVTVTLLTAGPAGLVFVLIGGVPIFGVFAQFSRYYDFTVAESPDGLRLRHGLLQRTRQTVPPGRVQAVGFVQPILWRKRTWVRVRLNIAGAASGSQGSGDQSYTENVLLPVAPWPVALAIVGRVLPGVDIMSIPLEPAPERSRKRAWIQWRQLAVGWTDAVFISRGGRITQHWEVVPHARTQSVRVTQGPWQRSLGLASLHVDSTPGAVKITAHHRDAGEVRRIAQEQADRAAVARAADRSTRWAAPTDVPDLDARDAPHGDSQASRGDPSG
ncbi:MAG: PH domain-containing protein [Candidatus Nanopelagicales bacterium]